MSAGHCEVTASQPGSHNQYIPEMRGDIDGYNLSYTAHLAIITDLLRLIMMLMTNNKLPCIVSLYLGHHIANSIKTWYYMKK